MPNRLGEDFRDALFRQTQGHPLFTVELLRDLRERGVLAEDDEKRYVVSKELDWDALPARVEAVIAERIGRLPEKLQKVLKVGSVEGEDLTAEVAARIEGIDEREIIRLLSDEADKRHQLVRALDVRRSGSQRLSVYRFRHILFQRYLYQSLDRVERSYLHEEVGNTLESLLGAKADDASVQLAHHFQEAALAHKAFHYLALSGDKARHAYATQEAINFYTQSIEASREMASEKPEKDDARLLAVYEGRGLVSLSLTRLDDAIADFQEMRRLAKASNDVPMEAESLSHLAYCHFVKMGDDQIPFMEQYALEARALSEKTGDQNILAKSLAILGVVHETRGNLLESIRVLEQSMEICRREGHQSALVQNLFHLGQQAYWSADFSRAVAIGEEGVAVSSEIRDGLQELFNLAVVAIACWGAGSYRKAFGVVQDGLKRSDELQNKFIEGRLINTLGWFHHDLGDFYGAVEFHEKGLEHARSAGVFNVEISALIDLGHDYLGLGEIDRALAQLVPTLERVENEGIGSHRWRWTVRLLNTIAEVHFAAGRYDEAARYNELGIDKARATSSQKYLVNAWALRGKLKAQHGDVAGAGADFEKASSLAEKLSSPTILYPIAHDFAKWSETHGKEEKARELYEKARNATDAIASSIENQMLRSIFLESPIVKALGDR